jgi:SpoIID/LytB domain protein
MVKNKIHKLLAIMIIAAVLISGPDIGHAATISDTYMKGISIGFTSMGNISTLDFSLTGDYFIIGQGVILSGSNSYRIVLSNSVFNLYQNNVLLYSASNDITIKPLNTGTFVKFQKAGYACQFSGNMTFKNNGTSFIPINTLKMEDYLKGVVPYEESNSWPIEALKAQAVAARTYAVRYSGRYSAKGYDLTDDVYSQVYRGYVASYTNSNAAVSATVGKVLTYNGAAIEALFSASDGGFTEKADNVWSNSLPYTKDVVDPYDTHWQNWTVTYYNAEIASLFKQKHPEINGTFDSIDIAGITKFTSRRINNMNIYYLDNITKVKRFISIGKDEARTFFYLDNGSYIKSLNSALYNVKLNADGSYTFTGSGYGHGVGLSQLGSYEMANYKNDPKKYDYILNFYYNQNNNVLVQNAAVSGKIISNAVRIGGQDRFSTSIKIAESIYSGQINNVVLSTGYNFPDALSGSVLAKGLGSPILLVGTSPDSSDSSPALNYINNHLNKSGKIYLLGGDGVIASSFVTKLTAMGYNSANIIRLGGADRLKTSMKIAAQLNAAPSTSVVIATENDFPDALSISPIAALRGWPILLTDKDSLSSDVENYILSVKPDKVYISGGTGVVSDTVKNRIKTLLNYGDDRVIRLGGSDRYATSRIINSTLVQDPSDVILTTGLQYPDALSGSVYAALKGGPIMLIDTSKEIEAQNYIKFAGSNANSINATVLGLQGAVSDAVLTTLTNLTN